MRRLYNGITTIGINLVGHIGIQMHDDEIELTEGWIGFDAGGAALAKFLAPFEYATPATSHVRARCFRLQ